MWSTGYTHRISWVFSTGYNFILWVMSCGYRIISRGCRVTISCGCHTCRPQDIILVLPTGYTPQDIILVLPTGYTPQDIILVLPTGYTACRPQDKKCRPQVRTQVLWGIHRIWYYILWMQIYIRSGYPYCTYPVDDVYPVGDVLWTACDILWVIIFILWIPLFISCGEHMCLIYPVENISCGERRPQDISTGYTTNYILWVYPVECLSFTDAFTISAASSRMQTSTNESNTS